MRYAVFAGRDPRHKMALVGLTFMLPDAQMMASQRYAGGQAVAVRSVSLRSLESMDARQRLSTMAGAARAFFSPMETLPGEEVPL